MVFSNSFFLPGNGLLQTLKLLKKSENWQFDKQDLLMRKSVVTNHSPYKVQAYLNDKVLGEVENGLSVVEQLCTKTWRERKSKHVSKQLCNL